MQFRGLEEIKIYKFCGETADAQRKEQKNMLNYRVFLYFLLATAMFVGKSFLLFSKKTCEGKSFFFVFSDEKSQLIILNNLMKYDWQKNCGCY